MRDVQAFAWLHALKAPHSTDMYRSVCELRLEHHYVSSSSNQSHLIACSFRYTGAYPLSLLEPPYAFLNPHRT